MPYNTVISYPVPAFSNVPIHPEYFRPRIFDISAISIGLTTTITTSINHDYPIGQQVRMTIPPSFGTRGLNEKSAYVISIPAPNQIQLNIISIGYDPFILSSATTKAQIAAIGDINSGAINSDGRIMQKTYINGSFRDISPE